jgi:hypothetical protein
MIKKIFEAIKIHFKDPNHINRDWDEFKAMTPEQLRTEFERLLTYDALNDKFRRLCQYIATHWMYDPSPNWDLLKQEEKKRDEPSPVILARIGDIVEEVQEWKQDDRIYLLEDLTDLLNK